MHKNLFTKSLLFFVIFFSSFFSLGMLGRCWGFHRINMLLQNKYYQAKMVSEYKMIPDIITKTRPCSPCNENSNISFSLTFQVLFLCMCSNHIWFMQVLIWCISTFPSQHVQNEFLTSSSAKSAKPTLWSQISQCS